MPVFCRLKWIQIMQFEEGGNRANCDLRYAQKLFCNAVSRRTGLVSKVTRRTNSGHCGCPHLEILIFSAMAAFFNLVPQAMGSCIGAIIPDEAGAKYHYVTHNQYIGDWKLAF
jgi:hypothetical protein